MENVFASHRRSLNVVARLEVDDELRVVGVVAVALHGLAHEVLVVELGEFLQLVVQRGSNERLAQVYRVGIALGTGKYALNLQALQYQKHSVDGLSARLSQFRKQQNNEVTWDEMKVLLGEEMGFWKEVPITWKQERELRDEFEESFVKNKVKYAESMYSKSEPLAACAKEILNDIAMVSWASGGHSAGYVPVFAIGAGSELFGEKIDNTEIPKRIAKAARYK